jgi:uncharacterized protein (DUF983 family)
MTLRTVFARALRLRCPLCGRGPLFRRYFLRVERCASCRWKFERGEGHWVGGSEVHMFASYLLSVFVCLPFLLFAARTPWRMPLLVGLHVAVSVVGFRFARAIFLALDVYFDPVRPAPPDDDDDDRREERVRPPRPPRSGRRRAAKRPRRARELVDVR